MLVEFQVDVVVQYPRQRYPQRVRVEVLVDGWSQGRADPLLLVAAVRATVVRLQLGPVLGAARLLLDDGHDVADHVQLVALLQPVDVHQQLVVQAHDGQVEHALVVRRGRGRDGRVPAEREHRPQGQEHDGRGQHDGRGSGGLLREGTSWTGRVLSVVCARALGQTPAVRHALGVRGRSVK